MHTPPFPRFLTFVTVLTIAVGSVLLFGTGPFLRLLEAENTSATRLLARMLGGSIFGMSLIYGALRGCTDAGRWRRVLTGGAVQDAIMTALFVSAILQRVVGPAGWVIFVALTGTTVVHLVLLARLRHPDHRFTGDARRGSDRELRVSL